MKIQWSAFLSILALTTFVGCGSEQFGTAPKTATSNPDKLQSFSEYSRSNYTLIKPKVDIVYVVDNSGSSRIFADSVKASIKSTVSTISTSFDYRVIATPLLETSNGNNDYQVMTNSDNLNGIPSDSKRIYSSSSFNFFDTAQPGMEVGIRRTLEFVEAHQGSLVRDGSHLVVILVSNGRDNEVETYNGTNFVQNSTAFTARLNRFRALQPKHTQVRFFAATAKTQQCQSGYFSSAPSYIAMANQLYAESGASDSSTGDLYDICQGQISNLFTGINKSIQQEILAHSYRYWPITFAESTENISISELKVYKISSTGGQVELVRGTDWNYVDRGSVQTVNTRILPDVGEPVNGRHFVEFLSGRYITYPDYVLITSVSKTEYFGYYVLPTKPVVSTISVRRNGMVVPSSAYTIIGGANPVQSTLNIKVDNPTATPPGEANPPIMKTGYMLKITNPSDYYKSGDNIEINYNPAAI